MNAFEPSRQRYIRALINFSSVTRIVVHTLTHLLFKYYQELHWLVFRPGRNHCTSSATIPTCCDKYARTVHVIKFFGNYKMLMVPEKGPVILRSRISCDMHRNMYRGNTALLTRVNLTCTDVGFYVHSISKQTDLWIYQ